MPARLASRAIFSLLARDLQLPAVGGVCDGLLLHRGVHDHALEFALADRLHRHGRLDRGLQQLLHAGLAQHAAEAADLRGVTGQLGRVVLHAAEKLPHHVLAPALDELLIAHVERMLQVQQRDHQPDRQPPPAAWADARPGELQRRAEQVLVREQRRQRCLNLLPRHSCGQHSQRVSQVDHLVQACAEEIVGGHRSLKTPGNCQSLDRFPGVHTIGIHPASPVFMRVPAVLQVRLKIGGF